MKQILIDKFIIPEKAIDEFSTRMKFNRDFIKNISGFIKDTVFEGRDEKGNIIILTIAEWQDEYSLSNAKEMVQAEYKKINFNPSEMMTRLNITLERGIYNEFGNY